MWLLATMKIIALAVIIYVICLTINQRQIGMLVVMLAVFSIVGTTVEAITPMVNSTREKARKIERAYEKIDSKLDKLGKWLK